MQTPNSSSKRRVKIVCTLGPATRTPALISDLIQAGMDVARLNFSHGSHQFHEELFHNVRNESAKLNQNVAIMQDLQGPKIRLGALPAAGIQCEPGDQLLLYPEGKTPKNLKNGRIPVPISAEIAASICKDLKSGARILFDDGKIMTRAREVHTDEILVDVEVGGGLSSHKGMNLPGTPLSMPCLTDKDLRDLEFGVNLGVDAIALSFVRSAQDIEKVQRIVKKIGKNRPIVVAKIEREEAIEVQDAIVEVSDALLVARGDMAVEVGVDRVPIIQKDLIGACHEVGVPIITATQMLESMVSSPTPTRAEASDVANAVLDGTDAVMLSGETASGEYPVEAVRTMAKIIEETERSGGDYTMISEVLPLAGSVVDSVEFSAAKIAHHIGAKAIVCITHSGHAARTASKYRPGTPIIAIMDQEDSLRKMAFSWGVRAVRIPKILQTDDLFSMVEKVMKEHRFVEDGDHIVVTAGIPTLRRGTTNMVKVHRVGAPMERGARKF